MSGFSSTVQVVSRGLLCKDRRPSTSPPDQALHYKSIFPFPAMKKKPKESLEPTTLDVQAIRGTSPLSLAKSKGHSETWLHSLSALLKL